MDPNPNPSAPAKRSLVSRIFRWLFLIVGAVAAIWALVYWVTVVQISPALNPRPRGVGEWACFILAHVWAIAFLSYLPLTRRLCRWFFTWQTMRRALVGSAVFATLLTVFYAVENWRGKRAWEQCKRDLAAKGELLEWAACIPAPIPDDENIIKAPKMAEWFIKPKPTGNWSNELSAKLSTSVASGMARHNTSNGPILLARLVLVPANSTATNGADLILPFDGSDASERFGRFVQGIVGPNSVGVQGFASFVRQPLSCIKPARIVLRTGRSWDANSLSAALPADLFHGDLGRIRVEADGGTDTFRLLLAAKPTLAAEEYLTWSDQCVPDLDLIREALKRPRIRMDDDYQRPFEIPIVNFVNIRNVAQTAAQRAQCCLLLGRSEQAFRELSLVFELRRLLTSKPTTLVAAMIDVAVSGLYADTIAEGFRLQTWREPELVALQEQLQQINLLLPVADAFRMEPVAVRHTVETSSSQELARLFFGGRSGDRFWEWITDPTFLLLKLAPRGWLYQNLTVSATVTATGSYDVEGRMIKPGVAEAANRQLERLAKHRSPHTILAVIALPNYTRATQTTARNQTKVNQALIVCASERYRLAHGSFPENLDTLVPQFVEKLPPDVVGGQPLKYHRTNDGKFLLYSVGWNEKDDGGEVAWTTAKPPTQDFTKGDWVWGTP
jgi:hypothetical protein